MPRTAGAKNKRTGNGTGGAPVGDDVAPGTVDGTGDQINGHDSFDPASLSGNASAGGTGGDDNDGQSRGRKPRSDAGKPRGPRKSAPLDLTDLKDILVLAHSAIAMAFNAPKLTIDETEGEKLAGAVQKVLRHYDLPDVASETKDWIGLVIVAGSIYGPRMAAHWAEKNTAPPPPSAQEADNNLVTLMPARGMQ